MPVKVLDKCKLFAYTFYESCFCSGFYAVRSGGCAARIYHMLEEIFFYIAAGSLFSLIGGFILLIKKQINSKIIHGLSAFAGGVLLATAFLDLLPEAIEEGGDAHTVLLFTLFGILIFFFAERFLHWTHRHHHQNAETHTKPVVPLIFFGDSLHNFIDGVVIAITFMTDPTLGILTTFAVAAHEIPQELGDFGLMLRAGVKRSKIIIYNIISALAAFVGAIIALSLGTVIEGYLPILLAITAGFFIYIAASDVIPDIHEENKGRFAIFESLLLVLGVLVLYLAIGYLEHGH